MKFLKNEIILWDSPNGINLPGNCTIVDTIESSNKQLRISEQKQIVNAINNGLFNMSAEFIWNRTIAILKDKVMSLGTDFVLEMLDRNINDSPENISHNEFIVLASELGIINKLAKKKFLHANELINYYYSRDAEQEMDSYDMQTIIIPCFQYILGLDTQDFTLEFNNFRERLKLEMIVKGDELYELLLISPYFYRRTTVKTILNLTKNTDGGEFEIVLNNLVTLFDGFWDSLISDDRYLIGMSYSEAVSNGMKELSTGIRRVLLKNKGFDYVPENLRSQSFIEYAKNLKAAHFGLDNFYNEAKPAENLANMGTIPAPAISHCISAALVSKLGNSYGVARSAQNYINEILKSIPSNRWEYYFNTSFPLDGDVLYKLLTNGKELGNWISYINELFTGKELSLKDANTNRLIQATLSKNRTSVINGATKMYNNLGI